ncbi:MAG: ADP-glyceromanno-heptose 6-epimerase [Pseudomonadota bacterium]
MILVTGAAGFIGSNLVVDLEAEERGPVAVCDWFGTSGKWRNLAKRNIAAFVNPEQIIRFLDVEAAQIQAVIHMGAISDTTATDADELISLNIQASVALWNWCTAHAVPFLYASSAATYGGREKDFRDDDAPAAVSALRPLNAYGWSKKAVDEIFSNRVARGESHPPQWVGLRFFNVYGPNEYHKGPMKSVIATLFDAIVGGETVRLFKSHRAEIANGEQRRDFIYVKDCGKAVLWFLDHPNISGIFNLGTGTARSFLDIASAITDAMQRKFEIEFIDTPAAIRETYQYFTEADMSKARSRGLKFPFTSLENGIADYVKNYLQQEDRFR